MKVKKLIELLSKQDPELPVVIWDDEMGTYWEPAELEEVIPNGKAFRLCQLDEKSVELK